MLLVSGSVSNSKMIQMGVSKNSGKPPKMDGLYQVIQSDLFIPWLEVT